MAFTFTDKDIERIKSVLETPVKWDGKVARFELLSESTGRRVALEIHTQVPVPVEIDESGISNLVSVYASSSFLQLQACTGFIASKDLGEVIFVAKTGHAANGLVVERAVGCSLYANVDTRLFSTDFTQLPPELIMSSVALSITEELFDDLG